MGFDELQQEDELLLSESMLPPVVVDVRDDFLSPENSALDLSELINLNTFAFVRTYRVHTQVEATGEMRKGEIERERKRTNSTYENVSIERKRTIRYI